MRFSKKLLAALLPITAASALAPVLSSCNKGNGYDISYGSSVNCLDSKYNKTIATYHTIGDVQSGVKNHTQIESAQKLDQTSLPDWTSINEQQMYYDFIASNAFKMTVDGKERKPIPFTLVWTKDEQQKLNIKFQYVPAQELMLVEGSKLGYANKNSVAYIQILNDADQVQYEVKSYTFQNTKILGE